MELWLDTCYLILVTWFLLPDTSYLILGSNWLRNKNSPLKQSSSNIVGEYQHNLNLCIQKSFKTVHDWGCLHFPDCFHFLNIHPQPSEKLAWALHNTAQACIFICFRYEPSNFNFVNFVCVIYFCATLWSGILVYCRDLCLL